MALYFRKAFKNSTNFAEWKIVKLTDEGEREAKRMALTEVTIAMDKINKDFPDLSADDKRIILEKVTRNYYYIAENLVDEDLFNGERKFIEY